MRKTIAKVLAGLRGVLKAASGTYPGRRTGRSGAPARPKPGGAPRSV
jgi:hypothetical protein